MDIYQKIRRILVGILLVNMLALLLAGKSFELFPYPGISAVTEEFFKFGGAAFVSSTMHEWHPLIPFSLSTLFGLSEYGIWVYSGRGTPRERIPALLVHTITGISYGLFWRRNAYGKAPALLLSILIHLWFNMNA